MKRKLLLIPIFLFLLLSAVNITYAASERISNFQSSISINKDGTIDVVEEITYEFDAPRHGIFREIPLVKTNNEGKKFIMKANVYSVTDSDNNNIRYEDNSTKRKIDLKIGDPNKTITGSKEYKISYKISGALTYFLDHDELYWNITGNNWDVPIDRAVAFVYYPEEINRNYDVICFTGAYGSINQNCQYKPDTNYIVMEALESFNPKEGFSITFKFPKGHVQVLEPEPDRSEILTLILTVLLSIVAIAVYFAIPANLILKAIKKLKRHPNEDRVVAAWFNPPKTESKRELTAGEAGTLFDRSADIRDLSATLIQLAQKGFIKISEEEKGTILKKKTFLFTNTKDWEGASGLLEFEKYILKSIFSKGKEVYVDDLGKRSGFGAKIDKFFNKVSEQLVKEGMLEENVHETKKKWMGILVLAAVILNPLLIIASIISLKAVKRTEKGAEALAVVKSLKNFVTSQEKQLEFQAKNQMMFEKLLPYAIALGIEKIWIERFKDIQLSQPEWLETTDFNSAVYAGMLTSFNNSVSSAASMSSSRSSSGFSSGFSGGGFSGGGGGGGGGGSW